MYFMCFAPGGEGRTKSYVAIRSAHPRVLPHCYGSSCMQEKWLASGSVYTLHRSDSVSQWGGSLWQTQTRWWNGIHQCSMFGEWFWGILFLLPAGCFVSGLYLEGAEWDIEKGCLVKSKPKNLVVELPILKVIPIETRRLRLQVWTTATEHLCTLL